MVYEIQFCLFFFGTNHMACRIRADYDMMQRLYPTVLPAMIQLYFCFFSTLLTCSFLPFSNPSSDLSDLRERWQPERIAAILDSENAE